MKRALFLLILPLLPTACERANNDESSSSRGTTRTAPADRPAGERRSPGPPSAAASDPELAALMTAFHGQLAEWEARKGAEGSVKPLAIEAFDDARAEDIAHCREIASYYGYHHPEAGLAWLRTLDPGLAQVKARAFASGLYRSDPEKAVRLYDQNVPYPLQQPYLRGMATAAKGDLRLLWPLTDTESEGQREAVAGTLIEQAASWQPQQAWEHYRLAFPEEGVANFLSRLGPMAEGVPYPIELLRQVPDTEAAVDHVMGRIIDEDVPASALEFDAIAKWLETLPPSETLGILYYKMAAKQFNGPEPERALEWARRNPDPKWAAWSMEEIEAHRR